jgi:hypothetical protein
MGMKPRKEYDSLGRRYCKVLILEEFIVLIEGGRRPPR